MSLLEVHFEALKIHTCILLNGQGMAPDGGYWETGIRIWHHFEPPISQPGILLNGQSMAPGGGHWEDSKRVFWRHFWTCQIADWYLDKSPGDGDLDESKDGGRTLGQNNVEFSLNR